MLLDANAFECKLTPEMALGIVKESLAKKGWKQFEVQQIQLIYVPFYSFSFDVAGQSPVSGKTCMNAFSGELNDFVSVLFERPLKKSRQTTGEETEVEQSSISLSEAKGNPGLFSVFFFFLLNFFNYFYFISYC